MSDNHDVIVIGAGISGVTFAHLCARSGMQVLLLESTASAGGCVQTERLDGGFWFELGAHTCYNSYGGLLSMLEPTGAGALRLRRRKVPFRLWRGGRLHSVMSQVALGELLLHAPRLFTTHKQGRTVQSYYGALVGARNYQRVFGPLFAAVPSQPADRFPAEMLFKRRPRRKDVPRSYTFRGGMSSVIEALLAVPGLTLRTGAEVLGVRAGDDSDAEVGLQDGPTLRARHVCIATPPPAAARMLGDGFPGLAAALARLPWTAVETLGVAVRAADLRLEPVGGIVSLDGGFYSAVSRDTVPDSDWRGFSFHFSAGGDEAARLEQAARVLGIQQTAFQHVTRRRVVLPSPTMEHTTELESIERALNGTPLYLTGNYFGGLALEDCALRSLREHRRLTGIVRNV